jgi:hypothetical protein
LSLSLFVASAASMQSRHISTFASFVGKFPAFAADVRPATAKTKKTTAASAASMQSRHISTFASFAGKFPALAADVRTATSLESAVVFFVFDFHALPPFYLQV